MAGPVSASSSVRQRRRRRRASGSRASRGACAMRFSPGGCRSCARWPAELPDFGARRHRVRTGHRRPGREAALRRRQLHAAHQGDGPRAAEPSGHVRALPRQHRRPRSTVAAAAFVRAVRLRGRARGRDRQARAARAQGAARSTTWPATAASTTAASATTSATRSNSRRARISITAARSVHGSSRPTSCRIHAALQLTTRLNGQIVQHESVGELCFDIPQLIEYCTKWTQLLPAT